MRNSLWRETVQLPKIHGKNENDETDVLIIGGGMAGVLCAYFLKQAGVDCLLIERRRIGSGISGNTTAKITSQHGLIYHKLEKSFSAEFAKGYWQAHEAALAEYRMLSKQIPCDFETLDNFIYAARDKRLLEQEYAALMRLGIPAIFTEHLPLPLDTVGAVGFSQQAQFHPLKFLYGIYANLPIRENTQALAFAGNTVTTNRGTIKAKKIIIATHFPIINKHGAYFMKMYQDRSYVIAIREAQDVKGMYLAAEPEGYSFRNAGDYLLLGGGSHRTGKQGSGWSGLENFAARHYPGASVEYRWAAQDCITLDDVPYIGSYSAGTDDLYVATGFNKWGMTGSMVSAMILTDLVQGKNNPYAWIFDPSRTMLRPRLFSNLLESTANLLRPTTPRCPHLGCALQWNPQEHSWDCPCHGSRFAENGRLLDNPANGDMKKRQSP